MRTALVVSHSFLERDPRVRRAVQALLDDGWTVEGLFLDPPIRNDRIRTWRVPVARRRGSTVRYLFEYGSFFLAMFVWVLARGVLRKVDVVYVNSPPDALAIAALPAKLRGATIILDVHDPMPELLDAKGRGSTVIATLLEWQERAGSVAADRLITVHEPLRDLLLTRSPNATYDIVMNVPNTEGWLPLERVASSRTLVFAGSVAVRYGLDDVIAAMERTPEIADLRLRIIGEGEDVELLAALADEAGVASRVEFVGRVPYEEVRRAQDGAWVGVNLPKPDQLGDLSFSNKIVEWVALGLPVIASRTPTLLRYFPEDTLFYANAADPGSIAEILRVLDGMDEDHIAARTEAAQAALAKIAWPVQREALLAVVNGPTASGVSPDAR